MELCRYFFSTKYDWIRNNSTVPLQPESLNLTYQGGHQAQIVGLKGKSLTSHRFHQTKLFK